MVGIITFQFAYNYGAVLQAYALKKYINSEIDECKIINYRPSQIVSHYQISVSDIIKNPKLIFTKIRRKRQDKLFDDFIEKKLKCLLEIVDLENETRGIDAIVTGSDQVWNTNLTKNDLNYFLAFANSEQKRISYGASVGNSEIVNNYSPEVVEAIKKFDYLSCREKSAIQAVRQYLNEDIQIEAVVDPTLLLSGYEWKALSKKPNGKLPSKYILYYALTESKELMNSAEKMSKDLNCPILSIHPLTKKWRIKGLNLNNVGPSEFLWLVNNAEYIYTNSFHGSVFSVIFKKKCILLAHESLGERNRQLLEWVNLKNESFGEIIDFSKCSFSNLNNQIANSKEYLKKALD